MAPKRKPGRTPVSLELFAPELAARDRIAAVWARRTGKPPSLAAAVRWALHEMDARLDLAEKARGAAPVFTVPGPMTPPPE
jgi:hypothetical protein